MTEEWKELRKSHRNLPTCTEILIPTDNDEINYINSIVEEIQASLKQEGVSVSAITVFKCSCTVQPWLRHISGVFSKAFFHVIIVIKTFRSFRSLLQVKLKKVNLKQEFLVTMFSYIKHEINIDECIGRNIKDDIFIDLDCLHTRQIFFVWCFIPPCLSPLRRMTYTKLLSKIIQPFVWYYYLLFLTHTLLTIFSPKSNDLISNIHQKCFVVEKYLLDMYYEDYEAELCASVEQIGADGFVCPLCQKLVLNQQSYILSYLLLEHFILFVIILYFNENFYVAHFITLKLQNVIFISFVVWYKTLSVSFSMNF